ncbi:hypothetical protein GCM10022254_40190 [Actinomadura meridiana]|uniref:Type II toxin-antitoxin system HicA family toxin n=1 Tax=Actinomadura meridiana TaxID=559626 RepID=A0ABP8C701_9ACTN
MVGKEAKPSDHKNKNIREVLKKLCDLGWTLRREGHGYRLYCPCSTKCTTIPVGGTPANPSNAAMRITRAAQRCPKDPDDPRRSLTGMDREE